MALQNDVDIKTVSGLLGHYSTKFTLDAYTNVTKEMQKGTAKKSGGFMAEVMQNAKRRRAETCSPALSRPIYPVPAISPCGSRRGSNNFSAP